MEAADPKHGRLMTGPSQLHDALEPLGLLNIQIPRVGNFFRLGDPTCDIAFNCPLMRRLTWLVLSYW
jgi:hypothetical protein